MQYVNLGHSGLKVSRIALGMMTFGNVEWRPWVLGEDAARPIVQRAVELGVNLFDTADMYSAGMSEQVTGRLLRELAPRDEIVIATKLYFPVDLAFKGGNAPGPKPAERPNMSGLSRKRIFAASMRVCSGLASTRSICTRSIASIAPLRSKKRWRRCTTSCVQEKRAISVPRACGRGSSQRCRTWRNVTVGRDSYRCRITTTWPIAKKSAK